MKAQETEAYDSQSSDEEVGDRDLPGKGLCLKKLMPIELVYFEFNVSLMTTFFLKSQIQQMSC
jgi:hypothetical protein